eukprot:5118485-Prymnesium_polylepis.1
MSSKADEATHMAGSCPISSTRVSSCTREERALCLKAAWNTDTPLTSEEKPTKQSAERSSSSTSIEAPEDTAHCRSVALVRGSRALTMVGWCFSINERQWIISVSATEDVITLRVISTFGGSRQLKPWCPAPKRQAESPRVNATASSERHTP